MAADPKLTYAVGEKRSQASFQEEASKQVSRKSFPSKVKFLGTACKYGSQKRFRSKVPGTVSKQGSKQEQGSQEQVLKQAFPERAGSQAKFPGARFARPGSQARFARTGSQARVPRTVPQVPKQGFQEQVSLQGSKVTKQGPWEQVRKQGFHEQLPKQGLQASFARTGSQARVQRTGSQELVRVPRTNSLGRFRAIGCQHGSHKHVPKDGFRLLMFPGTAFQEQLTKRNFEAHLQARLEARTESQARFRRTAS